MEHKKRDMENTHFKQDAKTIVDMLFDTKILKEDVTRDNMNATEKFIREVMQSRFDSHIKLLKLTEELKTVQ